MKTRLASLLLFAIYFVLPSHFLPCSYQNPQLDDVLLEVPIQQHPHRHRRSPATFTPLRIHLHYDRSVETLAEDVRHFVKTTLLPEAVGYWENALRVRPMRAPIRLRRKCVSSFYYYKHGMRNVACDKACREKTTCGEADIPAEHLLDCLACNNTDDCQTSGKMGAGVNESDFILYVTSHDSKRCEGPETLSYAAHCQQEADFDRPIAGNVNLCPHALSVKNHDYEILTSTVKHEILHALGFSVGLYAFFRDKDGKPRTKRNRYGRPTSLNKQKGYYDWDSNTITTVLREDWWTGAGKVVHPIHMMVTPKVREEARRHFGCDKLEGAELENQGGEGTYLTHWEKRAFENEAMTGTHTQNPVYSRLTLAFLEDTGWYQPNYEVAEDLHWGKQLGCDFAMKSCGEWIHQKRILGEDAYPYCSDIKHDGTKSMAITRCTAQRDSLALCNLVPFQKELPAQYRNFLSLPGVAPDGAKYYGGSVEMADYCPFLQEFEWKLVDRQQHKDSRCELESNGKGGEDILEVYGQSSRCFEFPKPWTERKCGRIRVLSHYMAGCYEYQCTNGTLYVGAYNATDMYPCYAPNQKVHIKKVVDGWLREGSLICPRCEDHCNDCGPPIVIPDYIGDGELDEPCAAHSVSNLLAISLIIFFFLYI